MRNCGKGEVRTDLSEIRSVDMVSYLARIGIEPVKVRGANHWYLSPLRSERTASFKVNQQLNRWYDHGMGQGGSLIDFLMIFYHCGIRDVIDMFSHDLFLHQPTSDRHVSARITEEGAIQIHNVTPVTSVSLKRYLFRRKISLLVACKYCHQVTSSIGPKTHTTIGFANDNGGYELRNAYCKISSRPKDITTIDNGASNAAVFEGFFDFLSYLMLDTNPNRTQENYVILNSVALLPRARRFLDQHKQVNLYLDRDKAGRECTETALAISEKYKDCSEIYKGYKDVNEWLIHEKRIPI